MLTFQKYGIYHGSVRRFPDASSTLALLHECPSCLLAGPDMLLLMLSIEILLAGVCR